MKLKAVDPNEYADKGVPLLLIKVVKTLNDLIAIDSPSVTEAMGPGDRMLNPTAYEKMLKHPHVIVGENRYGMPTLSGLGILNGVLMTPRFSIYIETEDDNYTYKLAGIMEDQHVKEEP